MLNNQNLNNLNLNNNINVDGIELGQAKEVRYVHQPTAPPEAHTYAQEQTSYLHQCQTAPNNEKNKFINKCFIAIIIIFMIASSICLVINDRNIKENKTTIGLLQGDVDNQSSNQDDPPGHPDVTPKFFVEDNELFSSTSPDPIFSFENLKVVEGDTPKLSVEDNKLVCSTSP